jgi:hypothetical protein
MKRLLIAVAFSAAFVTTSFADEPIKVRGCVVKGVEAGCLMLRTSTRKMYDITAAEPKPAPGMYGQIDGTLWSGIGTCMQAPKIDPAKWTPSPRLCLHAKRK